MLVFPTALGFVIALQLFRMMHRAVEDVLEISLYFQLTHGQAIHLYGSRKRIKYTAKGWSPAHAHRFPSTKSSKGRAILTLPSRTNAQNIKLWRRRRRRRRRSSSRREEREEKSKIFNYYQCCLSLIIIVISFISNSIAYYIGIRGSFKLNTFVLFQFDRRSAYIKVHVSP